jgi:hypothetical protein
VFIHIIKFLHMLFTLGLITAVVYCLALLSSRKFAFTHGLQHQKISRLNRMMLWLLLLAMLTGTLLVYPKHFTFHTPWIQAAYIYAVLASVSLLLLKKSHQRLPSRRRLLWLLAYLILLGLLVIVVRDAVTKTSFLLLQTTSFH